MKHRLQKGLLPMSDNIEQKIQEKGLTAPRVTPQDVENTIHSEHYYTVGDALTALYGSAPPETACTTFCILVLKNGFTVSGFSACASPENFDAEIGKEIARRNAVNGIWPLLGYELCTKLSEVPA